MGWKWEGCWGARGGGVRDRGEGRERGRERKRGEARWREVGGGAYLDGSGGWASGFEVRG